MPSLIANYLTVDPVTGQVNANFPGGVSVDESPTEIVAVTDNQNSITWHRESNGAIVAQIGASVSSPGVNDDSKFRIISENETGTGYANLQLFANRVFGAGVASQFEIACANAGQPEVDKILLDGFGQSAFLQRDILGNSTIGQFQAVFPGGSSASNIFTVTHNFNVAGVTGMAIGRAGGTVATFCTGEIVGSTVNTVNFRAVTTDGSLPALNATKQMAYIIWTP